MTDQKTIRIRDTAKIVSIKSILDSSYFEQQGWDPNYVLNGNEKIFRINIMGVIISKMIGQNNKSIIIEDKTGQIVLRIFDDMKVDEFDTGNIAIIVGKPREYAGQKYIAPEIIKKSSKEWYEYRLLQLEKINKEKKISENNIQKPIMTDNGKIQVKQDNNTANENAIEQKDAKIGQDKIYQTIKELDAGQGVDVIDLKQKFQEHDIERYITDLISQGEIFEIRKGRLKVLE